MPALIAIATAALVRDGRVLMAHRHPQRRWYPDCWDLVGGHVEVGEFAEQAVIRECQEELGVRIRDPRAAPMALTDPTIDLHAFVVELDLADPASLPDLLRMIGSVTDS